MKKIILDGSSFIDKEAAHVILQEKMELPDYYGKNLDALWDCLSSDFTKRMIIIQNPHRIKENLGRYGEALLRVFVEVKKANPAVTVAFAYNMREKKS